MARGSDDGVGCVAAKPLLIKMPGGVGLIELNHGLTQRKYLHLIHHAE
jgi:hypothetical protein